MVFESIWPQPDKTWNFDVSSLMVLIGEDQEAKYRLSQRSILHCFSAAPVVGLQNYIRSYDMLLEPGSLTFYSPYSCNTAPLRNVQFENAISSNHLLEDGKFSVFQIPRQFEANPRLKRYEAMLAGWVFVTWIYFAGVVAFVLLMPQTTWIGLTNVAALTAWSILIRLIEYFNVKPTPVDPTHLPNPEGADAIIIMGRTNSAVILEGSKKDIKDWTTRGLSYRPGFGLIKGLTRLSSLIVLLLIFSTIPNGHTMDQLGFILLNLLAQVNLLVGRKLNSKRCLSELNLVEDIIVPSRTHIYGRLLAKYKDLDQRNDWVEISGMLPKTKTWAEWKDEYEANVDQDPKKLYNEINDRTHKPMNGEIKNPTLEEAE